MKNYYKILQVDKDASPEIIKVAYKLLVKKNHPDLKEGTEKKIAEEKIKEINEAYEVLSEPSKKSEYDLTLLNESISQEQYETILNENINLNKELNYFRNNYNNSYGRNNYDKTQYTNSNTNNYNQTTYNNIYNNYSNNTKNNNYSNSTNSNNYKNIFNLDYIKKVLNEKIKSLIALVITLFIIFLFLKLPFIKNLLPASFNSNYVGIFIFMIICYFYFFRNKQ